MVNMTNRPNVAMRLVTFKLRFGHSIIPHGQRIGAASNRGWLLRKTPPFKPKFRTGLPPRTPGEDTYPVSH